MIGVNRSPTLIINTENSLYLYIYLTMYGAINSPHVHHDHYQMMYAHTMGMVQICACTK